MFFRAFINISENEKYNSIGYKYKVNSFGAEIAATGQSSNAKKAFWEAKSKLAKDAFDINVKRKKILEPLKDTKKKFTKKQMLVVNLFLLQTSLIQVWPPFL